MCLAAIEAQTVSPALLVLVMDGPDASAAGAVVGDVPTVMVQAPKHEPGMEQPRNRGVREVERIDAGIDTVWFLDSDIIVTPDALGHYVEAMGSASRILVGPYDWLPPGVREPLPDLHNDPRLASFDTIGPQEVLINDLSAGLACFGGNLVWPIDEFVRIGGFWEELHHGRNEDGELGLRAVACGIPISYVGGARGWHLWHGGDPAPTPEWTAWAQGINSIDVPKLNARHPWKELGEGGEELFMVDEDGKRFNVRCSCGWSGNTAEIWGHRASCEKTHQT